MIAHGKPALRSTSRADTAASTASHPNVRDDRDTPLVGDETARFLELIWVRRKQEYFCKEDWTGKISLNLKENSSSMRKARSHDRRRDEIGIHGPIANVERLLRGEATISFGRGVRVFREGDSRGPRSPHE